MTLPRYSGQKSDIVPVIAATGKIEATETSMARFTLCDIDHSLV